jgi:hypothetical protein
MTNESGSPILCKIGFRNFGVEFKKNVFSKNGDPLYGQIIESKQLIEISTEYTLQQQKQIMLHEILHGVDDYYLESRLGEQGVRLMANVLFETILNNKEIIKWIMEETK